MWPVEWRVGAAENKSTATLQRWEKRPLCLSVCLSHAHTRTQSRVFIYSLFSWHREIRGAVFNCSLALIFHLIYVEHPPLTVLWEQKKGIHKGKLIQFCSVFRASMLDALRYLYFPSPKIKLCPFPSDGYLKQSVMVQTWSMREQLICSLREEGSRAPGCGLLGDS